MYAHIYFLNIIFTFVGYSGFFAPFVYFNLIYLILLVILY